MENDIRLLIGREMQFASCGGEAMITGTIIDARRTDSGCVLRVRMESGVDWDVEWKQQDK